MLFTRWLNRLSNRIRTSRKFRSGRRSAASTRRTFGSALLVGAGPIETLEDRSLLTATIDTMAVDAGLSNADFISNNVGSFTLSGTEATPSSVQDVYRDNAIIGGVVVGSNGAFSFTDTRPEGTFEYKVESAGTPRTVIIDTTAPTLTTISRLSPATSPTNANSVSFLVTFDAAVIGLNGGVYNVDTADFTATGAGLGGLTVSTVTNNGDSDPRTWAVTVGNAITGDGTLTLALDAGATINDIAGNALVSLTAGTVETYVIDNTPPTVPIDNNGTSGGAVAENSGENTIVGITASSTDIHGPIQYSLTVNAGNRFQIHSSTGVVTVRAGADLNFEDDSSHDITVQAQDAVGNTSTQTFTIAITDVNEPPVAMLDTASATEDGAVVTGSVATNDDDVDDNAVLSYSLNAAVAGLTLMSDGSYSFDPSNAAYQHLEEGVSVDVVANYTVTDEHNETATSTLTITVTGTNDTPVAMVDTDAGDEDTTVTGSVATNDDDVDDNAVLSYSLNAAVAGLTLMSDGNYSLDGAHAAYQHLEEGVTFDVVANYTVEDEYSATATSTLTITLTGVNDAPVAMLDTASATEDGAVVTGSVATNDDDVDDNAVLSYSLNAAVAGLTLMSDGSYSFDPSNAAYQHLEEGVSVDVVANYTVTDEHNETATSTLTITVTGTNDTPVAMVDTDAGDEDTTVTGSVATNDDDVDDNAVLSYSLNAAVAGLTLMSDGNYSLDGAHAAYQHLEEGVTFDVVANYTVEDEYSATATSTLTITLTGVNDAPVAMLDTASATEDGAVVTGSVATNDDDVDDNAVLSYSLNAAVAGLTLMSDGSYSFDPSNAAYQHLEEGVSVDVVANYTVTDEHNETATSTLTITVTGTNDTPVAMVDTDAGDEDTTVTGSVATNDDDVDDNAVLSYSLNAAVAGLTLMSDGNYSLDGAHAAYQHLEEGVTFDVVANYTVEDEYSATATSTLTITLTGVNDAPVAMLDTASATEDGAVVTGSVATNDDDVDDNAVLSYSLNAAVAGLTLMSDGSYSFDPSNAAYQHLEEGVSVDVVANYTVTDEHNETATSTLTITVTGTNDTPVAMVDTDAGDEDTTVTGSVATNDDDVDDNAVLSYSLNAAVAGLTLMSDGNYSLDGAHAAYQHLEEGVTFDVVANYTVEDEYSATATSTLTITLTGVNDAPVAMLDTASATEDGAVVTGSVATNDDDVDDNAVLSYSLNAAVAGLTLMSDGSYSFDPSNAAYQHLEEGVSVDVVANYTVTDEHNETATSTLTITVTGTNDTPVAMVDTDAGDEDTTVTGSVATNDDDVDDNAVLSYSLNAAVAGLTLMSDGNYSLDGAHAAYQHLEEGVTFDVVANYTVEDEYSATATSTLTITLTGVNDAPVAMLDTASATEDGAVVTGSVATNDDDVDDNAVLSYSLNAAVAGLTLMSDGSYSFDPSNAAYQHLEEGVSVDVVANYTVTDEHNETATSTLTITVTGTNDTPVAMVDTDAGDEDTTVTGSVATNDDDVDDNAVLSYSLNAAVAGLTLMSDGNYSLDGAHAAYQHLEEGVTFDVVANYTVEDEYSATATSTLTITLTGVNDAPVAMLDTASATEDGAVVTGSVATNDDDVDDNAVLSYSLNAAVAGLTLMSDGSYSFDPSNAAYQHLEEGVSVDVVANYTVTDEHNETATSTLTITVTGTNDTPVAMVDTDAGDEDTTVTGSVATNDDDVDDNAVLSYSLNAAVAGLTLMSDGNYSLDGAHAAYQHLEEGVTFDVVANYTVEDEYSATATSTLTITLTGVNDAPVAMLDTASATEDGAVVTGSVATNDDDVDDNAVLSYSLNAAVAGLTLMSDGSYSFDPSNAAYQHLEEGVSVDVVANYTVTDEHNETATSTLTITVTGTNDTPVAMVDTDAGDEDTTVTGSVATNDDDVDDNAVLSYSLNAAVAGLTLMSDGNYSLDGAHAAYQHLEEGVTFDVVANYTVEDEYSATATSTLTITLTGVNDAPVAMLDTASATEDGAVVTGSVATNDDDVDDNAVLSYSLNAAVAGLTLMSDGSYSFDPSNAAYQHLEEGVSVDVVANYTVTDEHNETATSTLTITVTGTNDTPVAMVDTDAGDEDTTVTGSVATNDDDVDDNAVLSYSLNAAVAGLTLMSDGNYSLDGAHAAYQHLEEGVTFDVVANYTVEDEYSATATSTLTITLTGVNDAPVAMLDTASATEDGAVVTGSVATNDDDVDDNAVLSYSLNAAVAGLTLMSDGSYSFDPSNAAYQHLEEGVSVDVVANYTVTDEHNETATSTLTITVTGTNDTPVAMVDTDAGDEDTTVTGSVATNDDDVDDNAVLSYSLNAAVAGLTLMSDGNYSLDGAHAAYQHLEEGVTFDVVANYTVEDEYSATATSTLTITLTGVNDAPVAMLDTASATEDGAVVTGSVATNDDDVDDNAVLSYSLNAAVAGLTLMSDGSYSFDPSNAAYQHLEEGVSVDVVANYTVTDEHNETATSTLTITVTGTNDTPVAMSGSLNVIEDSSANSGILLASDVDDGAVLAFMLVDTANAHGVVTITNAMTGAYSYVPAGNYNGPASFTFKANDGTIDSNVATVSITVNAVNDKPQNTLVSVNETVDEGTALVFSADDLNLISISDPSDTPFYVGAYPAVQVTLTVSHGTLTLSGIGGLNFSFAADANGTGTGTGAGDATMVFRGTIAEINAALDGLSYTPNANYSGSDVLVIRTNDLGNVGSGESKTDVDSVNINVINTVNDAPTAVNKSLTISEDTSVNSSLQATDPEGSPLTYSIVAGPSQGTVNLDANTGNFTYTPAANYFGSDSFTFKANDGRVSPAGDSNTATVSLTINSVNDIPVATSNSYSISEDTVKTGNIVSEDTGNGADNDGVETAVGSLVVTQVNGLSVAVDTPITLASGAQLTFTNANGAFSYNPLTSTTFQALHLGQNLTDSFTYQIQDGNMPAASSNTATVILVVSGLNDIPTIGGVISGALVEDVTLTASGALTISDADTAESSFVAQPSGTAAHGSFTLASNGSWTYSLNSADPAVQALAAGATLSDSFTATSLDGTATQVVSLTITGTNDIPTIGGVISGALVEDVTLTASGALTISDADTAQSSFVAQPSGTAAHGSFTLASNGSWTYSLNSADPAVQALAAGATLSDSFTATSLDGTATQVVSLTITGTNDIPTIGGVISGALVEDVTLTASGALTISDADTAQSSFVAQPSGTAAHGSFTLASNGSWTYSLNSADPAVQALAAGATLSDSFTATSLDGTATQVVSLTITGTNDIPTIGGVISGALVEDVTLTASGALTISDADTAQSSFVAQPSGTAAHGSFTLASNGSWTYSLNSADPAVQALAAGATLSDSFTATSLDGTATQVVSLTITGTNDIPTIGGVISGALVEDVTLTASGALTISDADTAQSSFVAQPSGTAAHGSFTLASNGSWTYSLNSADPAVQALAAGATLSDSFTATSLDGTATQVVSLTITGTNDIPTIGGVISGALVEDVTLTASGALTISDADTAQSSFVAQPSGTAAHGSFTLASNGSWTYSLNSADPAVQALAAGATLSDSFTATSLDGTATQVVSLTITGTNDIPTIGGVISGALVEDVTLTASGALTISDADTAQSSFVAQPSGTAAHGSFTLASNGSWTYSLNSADPAVQALAAGATLSDSFTATSLDGTATQVVSLTITGTNDIPTIGGVISGALVEDVTLTASGALTISDADTAQSSFVAQPSGTAAHGSFTLASNGSWTYSLNSADPAVQALAAGATLSDSFTATSLDGTATQVVSLTITGTNDIPTIGGVISGALVEDVTLTASGALTISDADTAQSSFVAQPSGTAAHGSFTLASNGSWTYSLNSADPAVQALAAGATLSDSFTATSLDGTATQVVSLTITGTNDIPTIGGVISGALVEDVTLTASGALTISDADTAQSSFVAQPSGTAAHGSFTLASNGSWTYSLNSADPAVQALAAGATLSDSFTATSLDGTATQVVSLTITGTNDIPTIGGVISGALVEDVTLTASGALTISDADTAQSSFVAQPSGTAAHGSFTLASNGSWTYSLNSADPAVQALAAGATLSDSFTATSLDGTATQVVSLTITGTNDIPTIGGVISGALVEDVTLTASGALTISDVDTAQSSFVAQPSGTAAHGSFTLASNGSWTYSLNSADPAVQALAAGATLSDSFTATSLDGTATQVVTLTINGTNDVPVISSNGGGATGTVSVAENTTAVTTVLASDVDATDTLTYSKSGDDQTKFSINPTTGELTFTAAPDFENPTDLDGNNVYLVTVQVSDGHGGIDTQDLSVTVTDVLATVTIGVSPSSTSESGANLVYTLNRTGDLSGPLTVNLGVSGSAKFGGSDDYQQTGAASFITAGTSSGSGTVAFTNGSNSATVTVDPNDDSIVELAETIAIALNSGTGYTVGSPSSATGTITDNDTATFTIDDVSAGENQTLTFTISLDHPVDVPVTVNVSYSNGTATGSAGGTGADFDNGTDTVSFAANDSSSKTVTVALTDDEIVELNEDFVAALVVLGAGTRSVASGDTGTGTITNNDTANVTINDVSTPENSGPMNFTVSLSKAASHPVTVTVNSANGTATAGIAPAGDYTAITNQVVTFAAGETTKQVSVTLNNETTFEPNETLFLNLSSPQFNGGSAATRVVITDSQGQGTITNDDAIPAISINDVDILEPTSDTLAATFTVSLSAASTAEVRVNVATSNGTATAGTDYTAVPVTTLIFAPGETAKNVTVTIRSDAVMEGRETFQVNLTTPLNATIADNQGIGHIYDPTTPHFVSFTTSAATVGEAVGTTPVTVRMFNSNGNPFIWLHPVTVSFSRAGSATNNTDYTITPTTVTIPAKTISATINVAINNDLLVENPETIVLTLTSATSTSGIPANFRVATPSANTPIVETLTIVDNDPPTNQVPASTVNIPRNTLTAIPGVSIAAPGAGNIAIEVRLSAPASAPTGTISLGAASGLTYVTGDGTDDGVIVVRGTLTNLNTALSGLRFRSTAAVNSNIALTMISSFVGRLLTDTDTINIKLQ